MLAETNLFVKDKLLFGSRLQVNPKFFKSDYVSSETSWSAHPDSSLWAAKETTYCNHTLNALN